MDGGSGQGPTDQGPTDLGPTDQGQAGALVAAATPGAHGRLGRVVGAKIRYLRRERSMTAADLAGMLGIGEGDLTAVEEGRRILSATVLRRVAEILDRPLSDLFLWSAEDRSAEIPQTPQSREPADPVQDGLDLMNRFLGIQDPVLRRDFVRLVGLLAETTERDGGT